MFTKFSLILIIMFFGIVSYANPKPIGLELNKTTLEEVKEKYKVIRMEANKWNGTNYYIDTKDIDFKNVSSALIICNDDNIVQAVILVMDKNNFNELLGMLSEKYTLKEKNIPFVGNKSAVFIDGNSTIILDSPHLNFNMDLTYITNEFYSKYLDKLQHEKQLEKEKKKDLL
ncbi:hypothetical protein [Rickettsia endosymbiont of Pantilius tunicatus]|uniref:hypothetical protein n=1 Tax=Rickettsia endosymbiont of Pantilius tunicatus TaxID=3066267 RepID=UPI0030E5EFF5